MGPRAVAGDPPLVVDLAQVQVLALRAFPRVEVAMEPEAAGPVPLRPRVRVPREQVEPERDGEQDAGVGGGEQNLGVKGAHEATGSAGSVISVKSTSSSKVTRGTVYRMPSQQR